MSRRASRTSSEELFEDVCGQIGIPCTRVAEEKSRRPDYEVEFAGKRVIVEVKQFDPNDEEAAAICRKEDGGVGGICTKPGDRIRKAIHSAAPQLRALSKGERPAMLVVYNNVLSRRLHTDPYDVATAMQGLDVVPVLVPKDPSISPEFQETRSGPGKKMTPDANTTISAVGVLLRNPEDAPHLEIFHNRHARNPLEPEWLRDQRVRHFRLPDSAESSLDGWEEV